MTSSRGLRWIKQAALATVAVVIASEATTTDAAARSDYDVCRIAAFMARNPDRPADLTLISAHRGLWKDVPENTLQAAQAALDLDIETVEFDVRLTKDLQPVLMHDWALDRTTTASGFVSEQALTTIQSQFRRDREGKPTTIHVPSLSDALQQLADYNRPHGACQRGYLLVLDVKDKHDARAVTSYEAARRSWETMREYQNRRRPQINLAQAVVMKVLAGELPLHPEQVARDFPPIDGQSVRLLPILYSTTRDGDAIFQRYARTPEIVTFEVVLPYPGLEHSTEWDAQLKADGRLRTGFAPWNDYPEGTSRGTGACCNLRTPGLTVDSPNYTGNWEYLAARGMQMMTSDRSDVLDAYLRLLGRRNLSHIAVQEPAR